jgi:hypothetical protein
MSDYMVAYPGDQPQFISTENFQDIENVERIYVTWRNEEWICEHIAPWGAMLRWSRDPGYPVFLAQYGYKDKEKLARVLVNSFSKAKIIFQDEPTDDSV